MHWLSLVVLIGFTGCYEVDNSTEDAATCAGVHQFLDGSVDVPVDNSHGCEYDASTLPVIECGKSGCVIIDRCYLGE